MAFGFYSRLAGAGGAPGGGGGGGGGGPKALFAPPASAGRTPRSALRVCAAAPRVARRKVKSKVKLVPEDLFASPSSPYGLRRAPRSVLRASRGCATRSPK